MNKPTDTILLVAKVSKEQTGRRLDQALALLFPEHSRARLKSWVAQGVVKVNGLQKRPRDKVTVGDNIVIKAMVEKASEAIAQPIPLNIVYEDEHILVINKPACLVVHPGAGNKEGTLLNALLHYFPEFSQIPRAGIVHRLDKDTTGLMVVAKSLAAQTKLVAQLQQRVVMRGYEAIVGGVLLSGGRVDAPIGRHPQERTKMMVINSGKPAITHYRIVERFQAYTHLKVTLETGRTHQIRVHMAYIKHPLVGDKQYGGRLRLPPNTGESFRNYLSAFPRQALHARQLGFLHPITKEAMQWEVPLPQDMQELLSMLK